MSPVTTVLFVPGVGLWPQLFAETAAQLVAFQMQAARTQAGETKAGQTKAGQTKAGQAITVDIVTRPTDRLGIDAQVEFLAERCALAGPTILVGVSGGATLALACAIEQIDNLVAVVTHEPLVGGLEPVLDDRVATAGRQLRAKPSQEAAMTFVAGLYGPAWRQIPPPAANWAQNSHKTICAEVSEFAAFQPVKPDLRVAVPHLTTVGQASAPERHRVAKLLADHGAQSVTIEHSGHLVLSDAPVSFAAAISHFINTRGDRR